MKYIVLEKVNKINAKSGKNFENKIKAINAVVVRVIGDMVLQGF